MNLSVVFLPHIDGQVKRPINTLEDFFKARVIDFKGNWDYHLLHRVYLQQYLSHEYQNGSYETFMREYKDLLLDGLNLMKYRLYEKISS